MIYTSASIEKSAAMHTAEIMAAAARTAPKACGVDCIETLIIDGEDKDRLAVAMEEIGRESGKAFFLRDAGNMAACHGLLLIGATVEPRGIDCALCGVPDCPSAVEKGITCVMASTDLGIAIGSAAAAAMDHRIDNRVMFSAGMAALKLKFFPDNVKVCFAIPLSTTGKSIFFDRPAL